MIRRRHQKCPHGKKTPCGQFGFTLIELLLVCTIMGIIVAITVPNISAVTSGGQAAITAREIMAAGRYAHTMSLLYQVPVELVIRPEANEFAVEVRDLTSSGTDTVSVADLDVENSDIEDDFFTRRKSISRGTQGFGMAVSRDEKEEQTSFRDDDDDDGGLTGKQIDMVSSYGVPLGDSSTSLKKAIDIKRSMEGIKVRFESYSDGTKSYNTFSDTETSSIDSGEIRVRYHANGTVQPHRLFVSDEDGVVVTLVVDSVGTAKFESE